MDPKPRKIFQDGIFDLRINLKTSVPYLNFVGVGVNVCESVVAMRAQGRIDVFYIKLAKSGPK